MEQPGIEQGKARLAKAAAAVEAMEQADSYEAFAKAWSDFLLSTTGIYSKLKKGSQSDKQSLAWFARKVHDRKKDGLLTYLLQARNEDEHGLEPTTNLLPPQIGISGAGHYEISGHLNIGGPGSNLRISLISGEPPTIRIQPARAQLVQVKNQYGDVFDPPSNILESP
jgi:hypothetical protein